MENENLYAERMNPDVINLDIEYRSFFERHVAVYEFTKKFINSQDTVLDNGCGIGYGTFSLSPFVSKIIGIDISEEAIYKSKQKYQHKNLCFEIMDSQNLKFSNDSFDLICSFQVIEHIKELNLYLNEMKRVIKQNKTIIISTPNKYTFSLQEDVGNPFHIKEFYPEELQKIFLKYFSNVELYGLFGKNVFIDEYFQNKEGSSLFCKDKLKLRKIISSSIKQKILKLIKFWTEKKMSKIKSSNFIIKKENLDKCLDIIAIIKK
ncbi:MAG: class I SAM-dependent methyltransferase [bacterium]